MVGLLISKVKAFKRQVYTEVRNFSVQLRIHVPTTCIRLKGNSCYFFLGCLVDTLKEMFPGGTEENLTTTLTKINLT